MTTMPSAAEAIAGPTASSRSPPHRGPSSSRATPSPTMASHASGRIANRILDRITDHPP
jgi:hypothetical protein